MFSIIFEIALKGNRVGILGQRYFNKGAGRLVAVPSEALKLPLATSHRPPLPPRDPHLGLQEYLCEPQVYIYHKLYSSAKKQKGIMDRNGSMIYCESMVTKEIKKLLIASYLLPSQILVLPLPRPH